MEIRTAAAWGQGERGAAGYQDSGRSQLSYQQGELLGGLDSDAPGSPAGGASTEIPQPAWEKALDEFSVAHRDCRVRLEWMAGNKRRTQVDGAPLTGISADRAGARDKIYISLGDKPDQEFTHTINAPRRVLIDASGGGTVEIESADGDRIWLHCRQHRRAA